jgi:predicted 3-demethylubiquinone-9 3-methyltransferase (glyoxalase superfamily)
MPQVIQGYRVTVKPSDTTAESTYVSDVVAAGSPATTIHYPAQYRSIAISAAIKNQDAVNACQFSVNGQPAISLSAGADQNINNQNIVSIQVTPGAAGTTDILAQVTPMYLTTEKTRFDVARG